MSFTLANSNLAFADSGASAMPPKPSKMHQMFYKMYAPRTQTTYKQLTVVTRKVDDIRKDGDTLQAVGGNIMAGVSATGLVLPKNPLVLKGEYCKRCRWYHVFNWKFWKNFYGKV